MRSAALRLPLLLIAVMMAVGAAVETLRFGGVEWPAKLPLLALLAWAFVRDRSTDGRTG